jgi:hypothetical protein
MAGAVTHTWPTEVRAAIVGAVLDQGMSQGKAIRAAAAGELHGIKPARVGRTTVAGWVATEQGKRNREARAKVQDGGLQRLAEEALARALTPVLEDCELIAAGRPSKLTKRTAEAITRNVDILRRACPSIGKTQPTVPQHQATEKNGNGKGEAHQASTLADRLAARATKTTPTTPNAQRETPSPQTQGQHHSDTANDGSDSVSGAQAEAPAAAA